MIPILNLIRGRIDRAGVLLSTLCLVHCVAGLVLVSLLGIGGSVLLNPRIHEVGLALAVVIGAIGLGMGALRHRRLMVLAVGASGLMLMSAGLMVPDGPGEAALTMLGVALLASAHIWNLRHAH